MDAVTARIAILSGAQFVVSPAFDLETVKLCNRYRIAVMPGTTTLNGVLQALEAGADVIKIFPGEILGMKAIKAIHGPIPQAPLMPTDGGRNYRSSQEVYCFCQSSKSIIRIK